MASIYSGRSSGGRRGSIYSGRSSGRRGSIYSGRSSGGSRPKDDGGGGILGVLGDVLSDFKDMAVYAPAGVYEAGKGVALDLAEVAREDPSRLANPVTLVGALGEAFADDDSHSRALAEAVAKGTYEDFRHPLRNPGYTLLTALGLATGGAGLVARGAAAPAKVAAATGRAGKARAALEALGTKPQPGPLKIKFRGEEFEDLASRSALVRPVQRARVRSLERRAEFDPQGRAAGKLEKRVGKIISEEQRYLDAVERGPSLVLERVGSKLNDAEQAALRVVAEQTPLEKRIAATRLRAERATSRRERRRHNARIKALEGARQYVTGEGRPTFKPDATKLSAVYRRLEDVAGSREELLKSIGALTDESARARKTKAGVVALGGSLPEKVAPSKALKRAEQRVEALEKRFQRTEKYATFERNKRRLTEADVDARIRELEKWYDKAVRAIVPETSPFASAAEAAAQTRRARAANRSLRRGRAVEGGTPTFVREGSSIQHEAAAKAIDDLIRKNPDNPTLRRVRERIEELDSLRAVKAKLDDAAVFGGDVPRLGTTAERGTRFSERAARLGGALSVEKDKLATLRKRDATRREKVAGRQQARTVDPDAFDFEAGEGAVYVGDRVKKGRGLRGPVAVGGGGRIGKTQAPESVRKSFTGRAREHALERTDTTRLVAEGGLEAQKYASVLRLRERLHKIASPTPQRLDDVPMRIGDFKRYPDEVRRFLEDPDELLDLPEDVQRSVVQGVKDALFPDPLRLDPDAARELARLAEQGKIVWVPRRVLGTMAKRNPSLRELLGPTATGTVDAINNAQRFAILYLKPAYAIPNLLGNLSLNLLQQGFAAPRNLYYASRLSARLGPELAARIDELMGEGFAQALTGEAGIGQKAIEKAARVWSKGVDTPFRRSSFLHEARKAGYRTPEQLEELVTNPANRSDLMQVTRRANREIIDYSDLGPREREVVRRVVFFYPFLKGSTMYTARALTEHSVGLAATGLLARQGKERAEESLGSVPSFLEGSFSVGGKLVNPRATAIFEAPAQFGRAAVGLATGRAPGEAVEFATPALGLLAALGARRDLATGRSLAGVSLPAILRDELLSSLPQTQLARAVAPESPLTRALTGGREPKLFPDDPTTGIGRFFLGGLYPRPVNRKRLRELYERERSEYGG